MIPPHRAIYNAAHLYEMAFSFRDIATEVAFLRGAFASRRGRDPRSFLELAAGPAQHAIAFAASGACAGALDLAPSMRRLALARAAERGVELSYALGDMTAFRAERRYDLIATMLSSATYILRDEDFVSHLRCVEAALVDDGMYVVELPHPSGIEGRATVKESWTVENEIGTLDVSWSVKGDPAAIARCVATMRLRTRTGEIVDIEDEADERIFRAAELETFASEAGLEVEAVLGALREDVALDAEKAWRMVVMFRRSAR